MHPAIDALVGLSGQRALVTGGSRGIGLEIGRVLAAAGARVVLSGRDQDACRRAVQALRAEDLDVDALVADLADETQIESLFARLGDQHGAPDILVNCAGAFPKADFLDTSADHWQRMQAINLRAAFVCMQQAIAGMRARPAGARGGRVVNISSVSSLHPGTWGNAAYGAAKAGLNALTRAAALEFAADGITVNAVLPGPIASGTPRPANAAPVRGPAADRSRWLLGRPGTPSEVAAAVLFLAGPGGAYTTGQTLVVDGGFLVG